MIVPVGKTRVQEAQGPYQNANILFNDDLLTKIALMDIGEDKEQPPAPKPQPMPQKPQTEPTSGLQQGLDKAMNDSQSPSLNEKTKPQAKGLDNPALNDRANWKYDPTTGQPLSHESFVKFYETLQAEKAKWEQQVGPLDLSVKGNEKNWQMTLAPAANGGKIAPGTGKGI